MDKSMREKSVVKFGDLKVGDAFHIDAVGAEGLLFVLVMANRTERRARSSDGSEWYFSSEHLVRRIGNG